MANCCFCSVAQSCPTLDDPMDCSTPGFLVLHYVPKFAQTHIHWVVDVIQLSHPLFSPSSLALKSFPASDYFPVNQLFTLGGQSIEASASEAVLPVNVQGWFLLGLTISLLSKDSQESSPTPQFENINSSVLSLLYGSTLTSIHDCWKKHSFDYIDVCQKSDVSTF